MGLIRADVELVNGVDAAMVRRGKIPESEMRHVRVTALVDTGAYLMCINESIRSQLDLTKVRETTAELANGTMQTMDVVGPLEVRFANRIATCNAAVLPGNAEVLLGAIPMEEMDVVLDPKKQTVEVNPDAPYMAMTKIK